jgi:hypothetical protein
MERKGTCLGNVPIKREEEKIKFHNHNEDMLR